MKKTYTANIGGMVFHIDEDAYDKLNNYLSSIKLHFEGDVASDEIMADIESRIAEMFKSASTGTKEVITANDVAAVIAQLGDPAQISDMDEGTGSTTTKDDTEKPNRRLFRDPDDKFIAGICGGLGVYFGIDPVWFRVGFILATFVTFSIPLYLVLWIVIPKPKTTAEKLEMRGEKVDLSNIEKSIREDLDQLKSNIREIKEEASQRFKKKVKDKKAGQSNYPGMARLFAFVGRVAGIIVLVVAILLILAIFNSSIHFAGLAYDFFNWAHHSLTVLISAISEPGISETLAILAIFFLLAIPAVMMVVALFKLIFGINARLVFLGSLVWFLWVSSLITLIVLIVLSGTNFLSLQRTFQETKLTPPAYQVIHVQLDPTRQVDLYKDTWIDYRFATLYSFWDDDGNMVRGIPSLYINQANGNTFSISITREARGANSRNAEVNAYEITWHYNHRDSLIVFDPYFFFPRNTGWRNQKVNVMLNIPSGKQIEISPDLKRVMRVEIDPHPGHY